jgi:small multidrug resistance family-3 protein
MTRRTGGTFAAWSEAVKTFLLYFITAIAEILGCFSIFLWLRHDKPVWWIAVSIASLALFAWLLTLHPTDNAGRIYAAYGGVYIAASLLWMFVVEKHTPDRWDVVGSLICLCGAAVIYFGPRTN